MNSDTPADDDQELTKILHTYKYGAGRVSFTGSEKEDREAREAIKALYAPTVISGENNKNPVISAEPGAIKPTDEIVGNTPPAYFGTTFEETAEPASQDVKHTTPPPYIAGEDGTAELDKILNELVGLHSCGVPLHIPEAKAAIEAYTATLVHAAEVGGQIKSLDDIEFYFRDTDVHLIVNAYCKERLATLRNEQEGA